MKNPALAFALLFVAGFAALLHGQDVAKSAAVAQQKQVAAQAAPKNAAPGKKIAQATKDSPWVNGLGMKFVPVPGTKVLFSIWDTRVQDYGKFVKESGQDWPKAGFDQGPTEPAVMVDWQEAQAFCRWLTAKERKEGRLAPYQGYRLPTDAEWSTAVGLKGETGDTPWEKDVNGDNGIYPWGKEWPPPIGTGNYSPTLMAEEYEFTSPVGTFPANPYGLYDMGGNVWQWCGDWVDNNHTARVLRGGSWISKNAKAMLSSCRIPFNPENHCDYHGFRVVLVAEFPGTLGESWFFSPVAGLLRGRAPGQ